MKIILIGFMGSGKSTVAKKLSPLLQWPLLEMDEVVLQKTNAKSMHEVFAKGGELLLRETEISIAQEYAAMDNQVISTGAGVVHNKIILDYLKKRSGKVFFLNTAFHTLAARLAHDTSRPLFENKVEAESLYHFRQPLYLKYADQVVEVENKSAAEIAEEIAERCSKE
ncbi:MAG: shikimate kinase [Parachlamydiaceae bacterium]